MMASIFGFSSGAWMGMMSYFLNSFSSACEKIFPSTASRQTRPFSNIGLLYRMSESIIPSAQMAASRFCSSVILSIGIGHWKDCFIHRIYYSEDGCAVKAERPRVKPRGASKDLEPHSPSTYPSNPDPYALFPMVESSSF